MFQIWEVIKSIIKYAGPVIIGVFTIFTAASMFRWSAKLKDDWKEIFSSPIKVIFWLALLVVLIFVFYEQVIPLL